MANFSASKNTGDTLTAAEWNQTGSLNNLIQSTGQTLSTADLNQSGKAAAQYGSGNFFTDSGAANAYDLSPIGSMQSATAYFDGMEIRFRAANASSTASTINVNSLGVKNIKQANGVTDITTEISTTADSILRFDNANDCFIYDVAISSATTTTAGLSLLPSPITLQNNATDPNNNMDFGTGVFQFDDGSGMSTFAALTKELDGTWVAGTNQGGLDTGAKAADTWYYCYAINNPTTGASDALFTATYGAPTMPAGFTKQTYVGPMRTGATGNILTGAYVGNRFYFSSLITDFSGTLTGTPANKTITAPPSSLAVLELSFAADSGESGGRTLSLVDKVSGQTYQPINSRPISGSSNPQSGETQILVDSSSQIQAFVASGTSGNTSLNSRGFIDFNIKN